MAADGKTNEDSGFQELFDRACAMEDEERAGDIILMLVEEGFPPAQVKFATFLRTQNEITKCMELLKAAAVQGHGPAMLLYGTEMFIQAERSEDQNTGLYWIEKAAESGEAQAEASLALMQAVRRAETSAEGLPGPVTREHARILVQAMLKEELLGDYRSATQLYRTANIPGVTDSYLEQRKFECVVCGKRDIAKLKLCKQCKGPRYCSQECQKEHWPRHKVVCKNYR